MVDLKSLLSKRMKSSSEKMDKLAQRSTSGELSGFSGVFKIAPLTDGEKSTLETILKEYQTDQDIQIDLENLKAITAEVKAINNQAIILHGERIKRAQQVLKSYKEGAFTAWLIATYGNRQTPYNFLQYYEFYNSASPLLRQKIDLMPKQAVYTLASREGAKDKKEEIIESYNGEPKQILLERIRELFPLDQTDKRSSNKAQMAMKTLSKALNEMSSKRFKPTQEQKKAFKELLDKLTEKVS